LEACLAIDIGGTKLAAGIVREDGELLERDLVATPHGGSADTDGEGLFSLLEELVDRVSAKAGTLTAVGVGCGGPMSAGGESVSPLSIPAWVDFPLRTRLEKLTSLQTFVDNDAKALALGEGWRGAASGCRNFIGMVVSTGVGGGIVLDGRLLDGASGNAGHVGHVIVNPGGRLCKCGARGCLEAEASGSAIAAITGRPPKDATPELIERCGTLVGLGIADVCNLLDLELAVIAGSVALGFGAPFFAAAQAELSRSARLSFSSASVVLPAGLGDAGPLVGAGAVAWRALGQTVIG
jgi:glucokinase